MTLRICSLRSTHHLCFHFIEQSKRPVSVGQSGRVLSPEAIHREAYGNQYLDIKHCLLYRTWISNTLELKIICLHVLMRSVRETEKWENSNYFLWGRGRSQCPEIKEHAAEKQGRTTRVPPPCLISSLLTPSVELCWCPCPPPFPVSWAGVPSFLNRGLPTEES